MNFSADWSEDINVNSLTGQPLTTFHAMVNAQRGMYVVLFTLGVYFCWRVATHPLMHFNFRIIMASTAIYAMIFSGSRITMYLLLNATQNITDRTISNAACMFLGTTHTLSILALICSMMMVGVERHLATVFVYGYESRMRYVGVLMTIIVLLGGTAIVVIMNTVRLYQYFDLKTTYRTCIPVELYPEQSFGSFCLGIFGCSLSALWQFYLYRRNHRDSRSQTGIRALTVRFQQVENVHTTRMIYPIMLVYMLMCLLGLTLSKARSKLMEDGNLAQAKVVMQAGYMLIDICCIFCMFFVLIFHPGLRYSVQTDFYRLFCIKVEKRTKKSTQKVADKPDAGAIYFQQLEKCWK